MSDLPSADTPIPPSSPGHAPLHPEELAGRVEVRFGDARVLTASGRATPAGLVAVAVLVAACGFSTAAMVRALRR